MRKTDDGIFWMPLNSAHYWQVDMYEAHVGSRDLPFTGLADAVINSGASYAYIPQTKYKVIIEEIIKDKECSLTEIGLWKCFPCSGRGDQTYPDIEFRMGGPLSQHWFKITSKEYLSDEM